MTPEDGSMKKTTAKLPDAESFNPVAMAIWQAGGYVGISENGDDEIVFVYATSRADDVTNAFRTAVDAEKARIAAASPIKAS